MTHLTGSALAFLLLIMVILTVGASTKSDNIEEVQGGQIISMIENDEPVSISNVVVIGDLDFNNFKNKASKSSIMIENSSIYGAVNFDDAILLGSISFKDTVFVETASFFQTNFKENTTFEGAHFKRTATFQRSFFEKSSDFKGAQFDELVDYWRTRFKGDKITFEGSQFHGPVRFWGTIFDVDAADFDLSLFGGPASFWDTQFYGSSSFQGCKFNETADFTLVHFIGSADFIGCRFDKELYFNDAKFTKLNLNWATVMDRLVCNGPTYLALIKNFKEAEQFEDADNCYYQYRDWKRKERDPGWSKIFDYLAWLSCGYGVRWQYTILSGILVMTLFGIYFEFRYLAGTIANMLLKRDSKGPSFSDLWRSVKRSLSFSTMILLSLPSDWYPYGKDEYSKSVKSHLISAVLERMIGWGLMLLLIGTLTRLMVRY